MMTALEEDLLRDLDAHDALVHRCARGELSWKEFEAAYDNFFPRYPLDGHEGSPELLRLLDRYADRVALHHQIWEQVLTKVTGDEHLADQRTREAGYIGPDEAVRRVRELVERRAI